MGKFRVVSIKLEKAVIEILDEEAKRRGVSRSELIRRAIELYLGRLGTPRKVYLIN